MLIPMETLMAKYQPRIMGILHVGAHLGEEADAYLNAGVRNVTWVEANPDLIPPLKAALARFTSHQIVQALVSSVAGVERPFIVTNNGQSSSMLELNRHKDVSPDVHEVNRITLRTTTIDTLVAAGVIGAFNFINLDIQGAELMALKGAQRSLQHVDFIYSEVNTWELYSGCARIWQLDDLLAPTFVRVETVMAGNVGWGDGFWIRRPA